MDCVPGFVTERSVAQLPESERIEPAPGIMIAWKLGGDTLNLICAVFVPWLVVPSPVMVRLTVAAPAPRNACVTVWPVPCEPSPKSHAHDAACASPEAKVIVTPALTSYCPL